MMLFNAINFYCTLSSELRTSSLLEILVHYGNTVYNSAAMWKFLETLQILIFRMY